MATRRSTPAKKAAKPKRATLKQLIARTETVADKVALLLGELRRLDDQGGVRRHGPGVGRDLEAEPVEEEEGRHGLNAAMPDRPRKIDVGIVLGRAGVPFDEDSAEQVEAWLRTFLPDALIDRGVRLLMRAGFEIIGRAPAAPCPCGQRRAPVRALLLVEIVCTPVPGRRGEPRTLGLQDCGRCRLGRPRRGQGDRRHRDHPAGEPPARRRQRNPAAGPGCLLSRRHERRAPGLERARRPCRRHHRRRRAPDDDRHRLRSQPPVLRPQRLPLRSAPRGRGSIQGYGLQWSRHGLLGQRVRDRSGGRLHRRQAGRRRQWRGRKRPFAGRIPAGARFRSCPSGSREPRTTRGPCPRSSR